MKNKKMNLNPKKKCIYIKNIYISKNPKLNNSINSYFENKKLISDYNANKKDISTTAKQPPKKSVKTFYTNITSQKGKYLIKGNQNFFSTKNIHIKSPKREMIEDPNLFETYIESISGRKSSQKKYEVTNPFKERSNSENSLNYFTRTYSFFGNKNQNINKENINNKNINVKDNKESKKNFVENKSNNPSITISSKNNNELKINLSSINFNKNIYNIKNNNTKQSKKTYNNNVDYSYQKKSNANANTLITRKNSKKYLYKEQALKKSINSKLYNIHIDKEKEREKQKELLNSTEPLNSQINLLSPNVSSASNDNMQDTSTLKNSKRIQKYILSDKKRKTKSRQNCREYKYKEYKEGKSRSICPEPKKNLNSPKRNNNGLENKMVKNKSSLPIVGESEKIISRTKSSVFSKPPEAKIYYENNYQMVPRYYYEKDSSIEGIQEINKNGILFEQSALIIQSVFRGYLVKSRLETYLFNYKFYNKAVEILENLFISFLKNKSDIEIDKKLFLINLSKLTRIKNIKSYKSCKTFKLINMPTSPLTESEGLSVQNKFADLYLHKEIGERFNILKQNSSREKELERKHKEELDDVNNKIIKLIKENNILKNINQKNKVNESKYKELSLENKKKENIINIITNDNQNLAKKLKILKEKIHNLEIQNQIEININPEAQNKEYLYKFNNTKELLEAYRNIYLLFLFKKKDDKNNKNIKKYFDKYKNAVIIGKYENKLNNLNKTKYLNDVINNVQNKKNKILQDYFTKLYYISILNKTKADSRNKLITEKLKNLIIKKEKINKMNLKTHFNSFYNKGIISQFIEEKVQKEENKKNLILKNLKKIIISLDKINSKYKSIKYKNCFTKWTLVSKILSMKAVTDEKKRKKRQKQRTKRKLDKNKSANKFLLSSSMSQKINLDKNIINTYYKDKNVVQKKEKDKEKISERDNINYLEHTVTTDFSLAETNPEIKTDKIIRGTEKLNDIFIKSAIFYRILGIKRGFTNFSLNKEITDSSNIDSKVSDKEKKEIKISNVENVSDNDEDSGESSFGI